MIPVEVLTCEAVRTLPNYAIRVLIAIAAGFRGKNNGDLCMTWATGKLFGIDSKEHLVKSLKLLLERGLIERTRLGGKKPLGPTLYAVSWMPIDELRPKIESGPTTSASNAWARWTTGLPADQQKINQQDCRRTVSGLPADQKTAISGLPADQQTPSNGTAGSPPSRSWPKGPAMPSDDGGAQGPGSASAPNPSPSPRMAKFPKKPPAQIHRLKETA